jgi:hypothetical protein
VVSSRFPAPRINAGRECEFLHFAKWASYLAITARPQTPHLPRNHHIRLNPTQAGRR